MKLNINEFFALLEGVWEGYGKGFFPTIAPFDYTEIIIFKKDEERPTIHYEQRTWIEETLGQKKRPSHWETGFLQIDDQLGGSINNAQNSGRLELLNLDEFMLTEEKYKLSFTTKSILNDERIKGSSRQWIFNISEKTMFYEMHMATNRVTNAQLHLKATLKKKC